MYNQQTGNMKKGLLLGAAVVATSFAFAQNRMAAPQEYDGRTVRTLPADPVMENLQPTRKAGDVLPMTRATVNKNFIATSYNLYTLLTTLQTCVTANEDLDLIAFTHRQDTSFAGGSGVIQTSYTTDNGANWSYIRSTSEGIANRYPSGVIYNPAGNTTVGDAWAITAGPRVVASWDYNFFGSVKLDSTAYYEDYDTNVATASALIRTDLQVSDNGDAHIYSTVDDGAVYTGAIIGTGVYDANVGVGGGYEWTFDDVYSLAPNTLEPRFLSGTAWSKDGQTGYVLVNTVDTVAPMLKPWASPRIFKTTDGGSTWVLMPEFDFSTISRLQPYLQPYNGGSGEAHPYFISNNGFDMVVDGNGQLHFFVGMASAFSNHPDSTDFFFGPRHFVDLFTTTTGWDGVMVAPVQTGEVEDADDPFGFGIGWDQRLQAGRSPDGSKVFATWMDTDTVNLPGEVINQFPDVFAWSIDVNTNLHTGYMNFTAGTNYDADNFWLFGSDRGLNNENGGVDIPVTTSTPGATDLDPPAHYYMEGVSFDAADYNQSMNIGLDEIAADFAISGIYPNPANGIANLKVNLFNAADVSVQVVNSLGQTVELISSQKLPNGTNVITFDVSDYTAGMYFVKVTAGNSSASSSFMVH